MDAELLKLVTSLQPLGLAGLLAYIIFLLVRNKKVMHSVANNHLSGLPSMESDMARLVVLMDQQGKLLQSMNDNIVYIRARVNGKP